MGFFLDLEGISLFIEERKRSEVGYILTVDSVALCKNCHLTDYLAARLINEVFKREKRAAGADYVSDDKHALALHKFGILTVYVKGLFGGCGYRFCLTLYDVTHIELDSLTGENITVLA